VRGQSLRRLLLAGDIVALCAAFLGTRMVCGALAVDDLRCSS
jgi:hypothetical protein